ncbi:4-hydroxy-tetrahydrodipicolinate reductase [Fretibacter rubidus]|uniref:4-hydroxy-tetrahydrodipicolinate reductase n=1 Tax=Fretibacter rubidus TaxID=570162 RepID=UPI00352A3308
MSDPVKIGVLGADGRMGRAVVKAISRNARATLTAALTAPNAATLGKDAGTVAGIEPCGVLMSDDIAAGLADCDVLIDFSRPQAAIDTVLAMHGTKCQTFVTGTTGYSDTEAKALTEAAGGITLLQSGNFSLGVNLLEVLVEHAARALGPDWDIDIAEQHHKHKIDSPSGTALMLGEAAAKGRGKTLSDIRAPIRELSDAPRKDGDIGFSAIRGGDIIGVHDVHFINPLETLMLSHRAGDRSLFAVGAVTAALWAVQQKAGRYTMRDVLGL